MVWERFGVAEEKGDLNSSCPSSGYSVMISATGSSPSWTSVLSCEKRGRIGLRRSETVLTLQALCHHPLSWRPDRLTEHSSVSTSDQERPPCNFQIFSLWFKAVIISS